MTAPNGGAEAALEASDEQGRAECVDVAGRVHRRTKHTGGRADGDGGERLYTWMAGNGPDSQIDVAMRRALDASVGAAVIGRRTLDLGVGCRAWQALANPAAFSYAHEFHGHRRSI